ncbi:hypothetical protein D9611_009576 [Ephemerocybe angulata]|uniref:Maltose/galactoside acetyltransferase domain-containing protein n=1 Tax=Ephemerocybe angulata TaxID=980116 RepID=A0A8H5C5V5_9AGAR|nr:hypothetical protein D9611_009576 [Tulosesus angulatus]
MSSTSTHPPPSPAESPHELRLMISGQPYLASDPYIQRIASTQRKKLHAINDERDDAKRTALLKGFFNCEGVFANMGPIFAEYGFNVTIGDGVFIGTSCTILDVCPVTIGPRTLIGPNVQILTPQHPIVPEERNGMHGREWAVPVSIGADCWIGAGAIICPGVTIGDGVTVGAGSVVTKDVESRVVVAGNPARLLKRIDSIEGGN